MTLFWIPSCDWGPTTMKYDPDHVSPNFYLGLINVQTNTESCSVYPGCIWVAWLISAKVSRSWTHLSQWEDKDRDSNQWKDKDRPGNQWDVWLSILSKIWFSCLCQDKLPSDKQITTKISQKRGLAYLNHGILGSKV